ncbi:hypothetical protein AAFF_G00354240 [Aldrovandia affinis]|uniref:Uncharacterized protein n=1 Tax=Aldrovandia affinis TaxID=143900 RepID=A0AAD7SJF3_9TELE|nr:hypothetical protein AAFF_G00354240 [Aldrovandia affinis]
MCPIWPHALECGSGELCERQYASIVCGEHISVHTTARFIDYAFFPSKTISGASWLSGDSERVQVVVGVQGGVVSNPHYCRSRSAASGLCALGLKSHFLPCRVLFRLTNALGGRWVPVLTVPASVARCRQEMHGAY